MTSRLLAVDVGNTNTTLGLFDGKVVCDQWRISTIADRTTDEIWLLLSQCLSTAGVSWNDIEKIGISSVVPALTRVYASIVRERWRNEPFIVSSKTAKSIQINYNPPDAVGADRICNAVAGFRKYGGPLIIIDLGTATVFDIISDTGMYQGGLIAPGLLTAADSLHRKTAMLPIVELSFPESVIGKSTVHSIQSGILYGALEMIDGTVRRIQNSLSGKARVIATGGFAQLLLSHSTTIENVEPDLVLEGIRILTEES